MAMVNDENTAPAPVNVTAASFGKLGDVLQVAKSYVPRRGVKRSAPTATDGDGGDKPDKAQEEHVSVPRVAKKARVDTWWQGSCSTLSSARVSVQTSLAASKARGSALCSQATQWCAHFAVERIGHALRHTGEKIQPAWSAAVGKLGTLRPRSATGGRNEQVANMATANSLAGEVNSAVGVNSPEPEPAVRDCTCNEYLVQEQDVARRNVSLGAEGVMDVSCAPASAPEIHSIDERSPAETESGVRDSACNEDSAEERDAAPRDTMLDEEEVMDAPCVVHNSADEDLPSEAERVVCDLVCSDDSIEERDAASRGAMYDAEKVMDVPCSEIVGSADGELNLEAEAAVHDVDVCEEASAEDHDAASRNLLLFADQVMDDSCAAEVDSADGEASPAAESIARDFVSNEELVDNNDGSLGMEHFPEEFAPADMPLLEVEAADDGAVVTEQESEPWASVESVGDEVWLPLYDELSGCTYYWNQSTGATSWTLP